jgi:hypothetical protein
MVSLKQGLFVDRRSLIAHSVENLDEPRLTMTAEERGMLSWKSLVEWDDMEDRQANEVSTATGVVPIGKARYMINGIIECCIRYVRNSL